MFASARANDTPSLLLFRCVGQLKLTMVAMARHVAVVVGMTMFASARANDTADYSKFMAPGASTKLVRGGRPKDFGFLKDLGLEKPTWLPDFGDKAAEEPKAEEKKSKPSWLPDFGGADEKPKEEKQAAKKWFFDNSNPLGLSALSVALLSLAGLLGVRMRRGVQSAADLAMPMAQASVDNILELKAQQSSGSAHRKQNLRPLTALYATADSEEATAVNDEAAGEQATNDEPAPVAPPPVAKWSIEKDMPAGISAPFGLFDPAGFSDESPCSPHLASRSPSTSILSSVATSMSHPTLPSNRLHSRHSGPSPSSISVLSKSFRFLPSSLPSRATGGPLRRIASHVTTSGTQWTCTLRSRRRGSRCRPKNSTTAAWP